jgi:ornithine cyclodeaminase/alanine dehydrogenase-like protein (mu-crystallin family)
VRKTKIKPEEILYLCETDVKSCLSARDAINVVKEGIRALGLGKAIQPEKIYLNIEKYYGFVKPMIAYVEPIDTIATKVFSHFPNNPKQSGLPTIDAIIILTEPKNGRHIAVIDGRWITALRTAAATAIAAEYLARKDSHVLGIVGAGVQGRSHLMTLNELFKLEEVKVSDFYEAARRRFVLEMGEMLNVPIKQAETPLEAVKDSDIIITATTANEPLIKKDWIKPGMFIAKVGSYQEIEPEIITRADKVVVDWWEYVISRCLELKMLVNAGLFKPQDVYAELPEIVAGRKTGRVKNDETNLFISIGMGVEDAAAAYYVFQQAVKLGKGVRLKRS